MRVKIRKGYLSQAQKSEAHALIHEAIPGTIRNLKDPVAGSSILLRK